MNRRTPERIEATREGGLVERCHGTPHHGSYNVAQHSFGAVSLLLLLCPAPSLWLIKAVQWHDVAERWLGDMPSPAKSVNAELGRVYEETELKVLHTLGLDYCADLSPEEADWLKAVDILELWLWTLEEETAGNAWVTNMRLSCEVAVDKLRHAGRFPAEAAAYYDARRVMPTVRLPDYFDEVERLFSGPGEAEG